MNKDNMLADVTKISLKMKNKSLLSIEKNITEWEKILYYNYERYFSLENSAFL